MGNLDEALQLASQLEHELTEAMKAPDMPEMVRSSASRALSYNKTTQRMIEQAITRDDLLHPEEF